MELVRSNTGDGGGREYFTAEPSGDGFVVRDEVLGRTYRVPRSGAPTFQGRPVANWLTLTRIQTAVEAWVERTLLAEVTEEFERAA